MGQEREKEQLGPGSAGRVSIIMTTFNSIAHVADTLRSVLSQDYPDLEIVIADGGSTDGTVDVIKEFALLTENENASEMEGRREAEGIPTDMLSAGRNGRNRIRRSIEWVSEPDRGIYDGMNKAIRMSSGEILAVCNDLFTSTDAVSRMVDAIEQAGPMFIGAHADLAYMDGDRIVRKWVMGNGCIEDGWLPAHPTLYLKREVYEKYGLYDLRYHSSSDYEFMVRVLKHPENQLVYVPVELIHMFYGGTSNDGVKGYLRNTREAYEALKANRIPHPAAVIAKRILRTLRQFKGR